MKSLMVNIRKIHGDFEGWKETINSWKYITFGVYPAKELLVDHRNDYNLIILATTAYAVYSTTRLTFDYFHKENRVYDQRQNA